MSREQLIKRIAEILTPPHPLTADAAAALILDAVLPQITSEVQLDEYGDGTQVLVGPPHRLFTLSSPYLQDSAGFALPISEAIERYGPLTVVWQP